MPFGVVRVVTPRNRVLDGEDLGRGNVLWGVIPHAS